MEACKFELNVENRRRKRRRQNCSKLSSELLQLTFPLSVTDLVKPTSMNETNEELLSRRFPFSYSSYNMCSETRAYSVIRWHASFRFISCIEHEEIICSKRFIPSFEYKQVIIELRKKFERSRDFIGREYPTNTLKNNATK